MNPAALKTNIGDLPRGRRAHRQQRRLHASNLNKAGYATQPADRRLAQGLHRLRDPDLHAQRALARRARHDQQADGPDQELLRAGPHVLAVRALDGPDARAGSTPSSAPGRSSPRPTSARSRPATRSARRPRCSTPTTASSRPSSPRARTATSPATRRPRSASWPPASWPTGRCSTAPTRSRRPATSSTSCRATRPSASRPSRPRTRSRPSARPSARATAGRMGMTAQLRPGHRAQDRGHGPGGHGRAAARRRRRPARRPVDRHADQDRAGRPAAGHVRPQRRLAGADRRAGDAGRLLRLGHRGVAPRAQVHDPGRLPVRRASWPPAPSRGASRTSPTCPTSRSPTPPTAATFRPYQRDPETLARPWAVPGTPGLEHRIGGLEKADITGNVSYDPDNHHRMQLPAPGKVAGIADDIPPLEVFGPTRATCSSSAGARPTAPSARAVERLQAEGRSRRPRPPAPPQPVPGQHRGRPAQLPAGAHPGGQPRPAARCSSGRRYLIDAVGYNKVRGKPFRIAEIDDEAERILAETDR